MRPGVLLLCFVALLIPASGFAKPRAKKKAPVPVSKPAANTEAQVKEAERLYGLARYREAALILEDAWAADPDPRLVYNIARAWDQEGELVRALDAYQRYVTSKAGTDPTLLKRSALSIDRLRGLLAKAADEKKEREAERQKAERDAEQAKRKAAEDAATAKKRLEESEALRLANADAARLGEGRARIGSYVAMASSFTAFGTGTFFGFQARSSKASFDLATTVEEKRSLESATRTQALLADVGFGIGIAAVITAIVLYPKGGPASASDDPEDYSGEDEEASRIQLHLSPNGAGIAGSF